MNSTTTFAAGQFLQSPEFEKNLDRLAEVAVHAGLGLAPGQELVMTATLDAVPLARRITEHAYKAGASLVTALFTDEESALLRFRYGADASFDAAPSWLYEGMAQAYRSGAARLAITGNDPALLSQQDPEKVSRVNRATSKAYRPALELICAPRNQLDHRRLRHARLGRGGLPQSAAGRSARSALGRHLRRLARRPGRSRGRVEKT